MNEIIRVIRYIKSCREANIDCTITIDKHNTHLVMNALQKQIPMKPSNRFGELTDDLYYRCPCCGRVVGKAVGYCKICGQAIDWTEVS